MSAHPSFLELDRLPLGHAAQQTAAHVEDCRRCQAHLASLAEPIALPAWATALRRPEPEPRIRWWTLVAVGAALTASAAVVVLLGPKPHPQQATAPHGTLLAAKGSPAVAIYLKRGERVSLWDGQSKVQPGDRLRVQISPEGLGHVLVATPDGFGQPLYSGEVAPKRATLLPASWLVDESAGPEKLAVVLSAEPLSAEEARAAVAAQRRDAQVWATELTLQKTAGPTP